MMAVSCGTPTPAMTRVVQMEPGPIPTFTASAPAPISALVASAVATLPATTWTALDRRLMRSIGHRLFDILHRNEADAAALIVDDQQFLDAALVELTAGFLLRHAGSDRYQIVPSHQLGHRLGRVLREPHVAVGDDADQPPVRLGDRDAGDAVALHQLEGIRERLVGLHGDRVHHHAALEAFYRAHGRGLLLRLHVAVEHAEPAELRHHDRHVGFGHGVHGRGQDRDVERDPLGHAAARVRLARQDVGFGGLEQHVVEGEAEADGHGCSLVAAAGAGAEYWAGSAKARARATSRFESSTAPPYSMALAGSSFGP
jgi:hypothetical protein